MFLIRYVLRKENTRFILILMFYENRNTIWINKYLINNVFLYPSSGAHDVAWTGGCSWVTGCGCGCVCVGGGGGEIESDFYVTDIWSLFVSVLIYYLSYFYEFFQQCRMIPTPSFHLGRLMLIHILRNQDSQMKECVAWTRVMATLIHTYDFNVFSSYAYCILGLCMCWLSFLTAR